jgi:hypothetical protein
MKCGQTLSEIRYVERHKIYLNEFNHAFKSKSNIMFLHVQFVIYRTDCFQYFHMRIKM